MEEEYAEPNLAARLATLQAELVAMTAQKQQAVDRLQDKENERLNLQEKLADFEGKVGCTVSNVICGYTQPKLAPCCCLCLCLSCGTSAHPAVASTHCRLWQQQGMPASAVD